jgi:hypothetical protein
MDEDENIWTTAEWLYRDSKRDEVRLCKEPVLNPVCDDWFRVESDVGVFLHVCYRKEILSFRRQYSTLYTHICDHPAEFRERQSQCNSAQNILWSAWGCMGKDGSRQPLQNSGENGLDDLFELGYENVWYNTCNRCCTPLPKQLQMWVKLQHSKLAKALE